MRIKAILMAGAMLAVAGTAAAEGYNRASISYDLNNYTAGGDLKEIFVNDEKSMTTNGFGINYIHGFGITSLPMYIEVGGSFNFNFWGDTHKVEDYGEWLKYKVQFQNINLTIPVNYTYRFEIGDHFKISPFAGINFKFNLATRGRAYYDIKGIDKDDKKWVNLLKADEENGVYDDETWNVFQMGWQAGANFSYDSFVLGLQVGTDFIPAYSHTDKEYNWKGRVDQFNFKLSLGYEF